MNTGNTKADTTSKVPTEIDEPSRSMAVAWQGMTQDYQSPTVENQQ